MADNGYRITHSNYVLRKKHQSVSGGTIYERDFMTTTNLGQWDSGSIPYGENNFRFVYRTSTTNRKRPDNIEWKEWSEDEVGNYEKTSEDEPRLKPNYSSLLDFAYFGSCTELVKSTITKILSDYPPVLTISNTSYDINGTTYYIVENPFDMDLTTEHVSESDRKWQFMSNSWENYTYDGKAITNLSITNYDNVCEMYGSMWARTDFETEEGDRISIYTIYFVDSPLLFIDGDSSMVGKKIKAKPSIYEDFFKSVDDFEVLLLNRDSNPIYTARIDYPHETERGFETYKIAVTWPSDPDDGTLIVSGVEYYGYINKLLDIAKFYDSYFSNNLWRMLTHDSIKNLDITFSRPEKDEDTEDFNIGTGKMEGFMWAVGRLFDDIKRNIDNIKNNNRVTYTGDNNIPDYYLTDSLNLSGWETYDVGSDLSGSTATINGVKYDYTDASVEFLKNLKLNTRGIFNRKGTRCAIEDILGMFGLVSYDFARLYALRNGMEWDENDGAGELYDYKIEEYVAVVDEVADSEAIKDWNKRRSTYPSSIEEINAPDFYDLPVAEVFITKESGETESYIVPWFDKDAGYSSGMYFQMNGGWMHGSNIDESGSTYEESYHETIKYLNTVESTEDLVGVPDDRLYAHRICYVVDPSDWTGETTNTHYFVKSKDSEEWSPIEENGLIAYLESIIENFDGNNPHVGYGWYDDGKEYIEHLKHLFKYDYENDSADSPKFNDDAYDCETGKLLDGYDVGFSVVPSLVDSQKVWYFHNAINDNKCEPIDDVDIDPYTPGCGGCTFETKMRPFNFEGGEAYQEGAANSIINVKNIKITFYAKWPEFGKYFSDCILPYLTQVMPSTSIFEYDVMIMGLASAKDTASYYKTTLQVDGIVGSRSEANDDIIFNYNKGYRTNPETGELEPVQLKVTNNNE